MALTTGIIIIAPISKAPIILIEIATKVPINAVNNRFINLTFLPLEIANSSLKDIKRSVC